MGICYNEICNASLQSLKESFFSRANYKYHKTTLKKASWRPQRNLTWHKYEPQYPLRFRFTNSDYRSQIILTTNNAKPPVGPLPQITASQEASWTTWIRETRALTLQRRVCRCLGRPRGSLRCVVLIRCSWKLCPNGTGWFVNLAGRGGGDEDVKNGSKSPRRRNWLVDWIFTLRLRFWHPRNVVWILIALICILWQCFHSQLGKKYWPITMIGDVSMSSLCSASQTRKIESQYEGVRIVFPIGNTITQHLRCQKMR